MMKTASYLWFTFLFSFLSISAFSQETLHAFISQKTVLPGEMVDLEVKVTNFENMFNAQFGIIYDSTVIDFVTVGDFGLPMVNDENFGTPDELGKKHISFLWVADDIINGQTVPDSTSIFSLTFQVIGSDGDSTGVVFTTDPPDVIEFGSTMGVLPFELTDGYVKVDMNVDVQEVVTQDFVLFPITPNPIRDKAIIRFNLAQKSQTDLLILNAAGQQVYEASALYQAGEHTLELAKNVFPAAGNYFVKFATDKSIASQKIMVVD